MSGIYSQGNLQRPVSGADESTLARLRTGQMLRALRETAALGGGPPPRVVGLSGTILEDGESGGDGARVIDGGG